MIGFIFKQNIMSFDDDINCPRTQEKIFSIKIRFDLIHSKFKQYSLDSLVTKWYLGIFKSIINIDYKIVFLQTVYCIKYITILLIEYDANKFEFIIYYEIIV